MLDYLEQNYVGMPNRRGPGRQNALFPIRLWNLYEIVLNGQARTNNAVEGWHRGIETLLQMAHPTVWKLIDGKTNYKVRYTVYNIAFTYF